MKKWKTIIGLCLCVFCANTGHGQTTLDLRTQSKNVDFSGAASTKPMQAGPALPAACTVGQFFFLNSAPAGSNVYACSALNTWTLEGNSLSVTAGTANDVLSSNGSTIQWLPLGGDISGAPGTMTVNRLQGRALSTTAPSNGQVLQWNASMNQWTPAAPQSGNAAYAFTSQTTISIPGTLHQFGTANLIVNCYDNSSPPQNVEPDKIQVNPANYNVTINFSAPQSGYCVVNGAGTAAVGNGGGYVNSVFGRSGVVTAQAGDYNFGQISGTVSSSQLPSAGGDVNGSWNSTIVTALQNRNVAGTAPANGQALIWNSANSTWQPGTVSGGGAVASVFGRTGAVTAQVGDYNFSQIAGTLGSSQLPNTGGDLSGSLTAATVTGLQNRPLSNVAPANGQALVWNSGASTWQPGTVSGGGAVSSVFGRTGAVSSQYGDYSFGEISGTVGISQLPAAGGDLSGSLTSATVRSIQGEPVASTMPSNGQALVWNSTAGAWQPGSISGSGGASFANQLGDLLATRSSSTVLTIGAGCSATSPCNVRFGYQVFSISTSATATISGSASGTAYIYVNNAGNLVVGHNLAVACSAGCLQQTGITSFPPNVLPIFIWTATNGTWDITGGRDQRAFLSSKTLAAGQGLVITETPGQSTVAVDNGVVPTYLMNSATLSYSPIANGACATDQTITVSGANPGDAVAPGWPTLPTGVLGAMLVGTANTVTVRLCNLSGLTVTPPSAIYRAVIVRNY